jgi:hypothetical protein
MGGWVDVGKSESGGRTVKAIITYNDGKTTEAITRADIELAVNDISGYGEAEKTCPFAIKTLEIISFDD